MSFHSITLYKGRDSKISKLLITVNFILRYRHYHSWIDYLYSFYVLCYVIVSYNIYDTSFISFIDVSSPNLSYVYTFIDWNKIESRNHLKLRFKNYDLNLLINSLYLCDIPYLISIIKMHSCFRICYYLCQVGRNQTLFLCFLI